VKRALDAGHFQGEPQRRISTRHSTTVVWLLCLCLTLLCLPSNVVIAQQPRPGEYQVKAAYIYNFSHFVEWPAPPSAGQVSPFAICVLGKDPFGAVLDRTLSGESIGTDNMIARRLSKPQEALGCRILFVGLSEKDHLKEILGALGKASVLTVSDIPRFSEHGGMIGFVLEGDKVRFEVNLTNATDAGLAVSSDLLKVAIAVRRNRQSGA
jgi:hypothetical protein